MRYHYMITIQTTAPSGLTCGSDDGTIDLRPGRSRQEVFRGIFQDMCHKMGIRDLGRASVLYFSLEPNDLT